MKKILSITLLFLFAFTLSMLTAPVFGAEIATGLGVATLGASFIPMPVGVLGMNTVAARLIYENAKAAMQRAGLNPSASKMTQSFLRLEQDLSTNKATYTFSLLNQNSGSAKNTEQRLGLQDSFIVSSVGLFLAKPSGATDSAFELDTCANDVTYTNAAAMNAVYNGVLQIGVNNDLILPAWDLQRHFYRAQTQLTAAANSPKSGKRLAEDAFYAVEPNITLIGTKNNNIQIVLPQALTAVDANSRLVLFFRGILAQNSTSVS